MKYCLESLYRLFTMYNCITMYYRGTTQLFIFDVMFVFLHVIAAVLSFCHACRPKVYEMYQHIKRSYCGHGTNIVVMYVTLKHTLFCKHMFCTQTPTQIRKLAMFTLFFSLANAYVFRFPSGYKYRTNLHTYQLSICIAYIYSNVLLVDQALGDIRTCSMFLLANNYDCF